MSRKIDPMDVVGKKYGIFEVLDYIGPSYRRSDGSQQKTHKYKIRCTLCGDISTALRGNLKKIEKQSNCMKCYSHEHIARPKSMRKQDEIVGTVIGGYEVIGLSKTVQLEVGKDKKKRYRYYYDCKCTSCGGMSVHSYEVLRKTEKRTRRCPCCEVSPFMEKIRLTVDRKKQRETMLDTCEKKRRTVKGAASYNHTTGIRHYSITTDVRERKGNLVEYYHHTIIVMLRGKSYKVINRSLPTKEINEEIKRIAEEVNRKILEGDDVFIGWYNRYKSAIE